MIRPPRPKERPTTHTERGPSPIDYDERLLSAFPSFAGDIDGLNTIAGMRSLNPKAPPLNVLDELDVWGGELDYLLGRGGGLSVEARANLAAGRAYLEKVLERAGPTAQGKPGPAAAWLRGVGREGRLEAAAIVAPPEKAVRYLEIEYLAAAPWNQRGVELEGYENMRGAGSALVKLMTMESVCRGLGGRVMAMSAPAAVSFYEKLGFVAQGRGGDQTAMLLDERGAEALLTPPSKGWRTT
jgi:hypothetical protein